MVRPRLISESRPLLVVSGATATGKSALALRLAAELDGEIISCDSVQVYPGFDIGSAKPTKAELREIPHHLIDCCAPDEQYHAARFRADALAKIEDLFSRGKQPIIVGGTTLYLSALISGLSEYPDSDPELRGKLQKMDPIERYGLLKERDPSRAEQLHPNDNLRVVRALELSLQLENTSSEEKERMAPQCCPYPALALNLCVPNNILRERIYERTRKMLNEGLIEEARQLREKLPSTAPGLSTVGYQEAGEFLEGNLAGDLLEERISTATARLAKRQRTFWRNEPVKRGWRVLPDETEISSNITRYDDEAVGQRKKGMQKGFCAYAINVDQLCARLRQRVLVIKAGTEIWNLAMH